MDYVGEYLQETIAIASQIDQLAIEQVVDRLAQTRAGSGIVYVLGLGGSLANASHVAADFRMRAGLRAEAPESLPELTAYANDYGWERMLTRWLEVRHLCAADLVLVLSVGGGGIPTTLTSWPLIDAVKSAAYRRTRTVAIVGEPGGEIADIAE